VLPRSISASVIQKIRGQQDENQGIPDLRERGLSLIYVKIEFGIAASKPKIHN
jgi:hypothetical protein